MSFSVVRKPLVVGLILSLAGSGVVWAKHETAPGAAHAATELASQDVETSARNIALVRWRQYLRNIGWPEVMVQQSRPSFLNIALDRTSLPNGDWTFVFDGSRRGELRTVTLTVDSFGNERGEAIIEWADILEVE